ncbi:uncharacterized protein LOC128249942 isoform X2 [Octopus bimaculoides]|uniref:uncharacterized protein LOC128249942 isoform X2 n=1 Tax=Octopus bimaculoides TaxID=37653 RepID=UPI0022DEFFF0|nr:uncharacterized protein LOC128249942 isoform X2 [Octopus bimaculoides]
MIRTLIFIALLISHAATLYVTWNDCIALAKEKCGPEYKKYLSVTKDCGGYVEFTRCFKPSIDSFCRKGFDMDHRCTGGKKGYRIIDTDTKSSSHKDNMASPISTILTALVVILFKKN